MERLLIYIFTILCFISGSIGRKGFKSGEQEWGYVEVRPYAHMFWWLYFTTADVKSYYDKPLIIWLQGGPGGSSTAYGNFMTLGPLGVNLNPRNYTWVKNYNVLFIDNPVGAGFSYVNDISKFATTNAQIASDLLKCMRGFYKQLPKFKSVPTYITSESYGGKMGAEFALVWARAQKARNIKSNLKGIALGDAWISPIDYVMTWGLFLLNMGMIDTHDFENIESKAKLTENNIKNGEWKMATDNCASTQNMIKKTTYNIDFYNILEKRNFSFFDLKSESTLLNYKDEYKSFFERQVDVYYHYSLNNLMNGAVKEALGLEVNYNSQSRSVLYHLLEDYMKPVTNIVELLLNETDLEVYVYNGLLDLMVDAPGTYSWVEKLKWKGADAWKTDSIREPVVVQGIVEAYVKSSYNFAMFWVYRAGLMVPRDNPAAMELILRYLTLPINESKN